jgi:hypothetical protein
MLFYFSISSCTLWEKIKQINLQLKQIEICKTLFHYLYQIPKNYVLYIMNNSYQQGYIKANKECNIQIKHLNLKITKLKENRIKENRIKEKE